jgi:hypothetical protein
MVCFSDLAANVLYEKFMDDQNNNVKLLELLNSVLKEVGENKIERIEDFELSREKLKQLNASKFVEMHINKLKDYGMDKKYIKYYKRKEIKGYYITFLKLIIKYFGFNLKSKIKTNNNNRLLFYYCKK